MRLGIVLILFFCVISGLKSQVINELWQTEAIFSEPSSALYNDMSATIYVSNVGGELWDQDGNGFISKLDKNGKVLNLRWVKGLDAPKGMALTRNTLYVADVKFLVSINIEKGEVERRYTIDGAMQMTDVCVGANGNIFVSDKGAKTIYCLKKGKLEVWNNRLKNFNVAGITYTEGMLYLGTKHLLSTSSTSNNSRIVYTIPEAGISINGLAGIGKGWFLVSSTMGELKLIHTMGKKVGLLNYRDRNIGLGDFHLNRSDKTIYIPTLNDNRMIAFTYQF